MAAALERRRRARRARREGASLRPAAGGIWANARAGTPLLVRTLSLRARHPAHGRASPTGLGAVALAAHQVVNAVWGSPAFALDALAIAAQALVGHALGAADVPRVRALLRRTLAWGVGAGAVLGLVVGGLALGCYVPLFTSDDDVRTAAVAALVVAGRDAADGRLGVRARRRAHRRRRRTLPRLGRHGHVGGVRAVRAGRPRCGPDGRRGPGVAVGRVRRRLHAGPRA